MVERGHITPEIFFDLLGADGGPDRLIRRLLLHLLDGCPECQAAWSDFFPEAIEREDDYGQAFASLRTRLREEQGAIATERTEARALCDELLSLSESEQLARIARTRSKLVSRSVVTELLSRSLEAGFRDPRESERLADLARELTFRLSVEGAVFHDLQALIAAHKGNARRVACDLPAANKFFENAEVYVGQGTGDVLLQAQVLNLHSSYLRAVRDLPRALNQLETVEYIFRALGNRLSLARVLLKKGQILRDQDRLRAAVAAAEGARGMLGGLHEPRLLFAALVNLALYHTELGEHQTAQGFLDASLPIGEEFRSTSMWTYRTWTAGMVFLGLGKRGNAEEAYQEARASFRRIGNSYDYALTSLDLAALYAEEGRLAEVAEVAEEIHPIFRAHKLHEEAEAVIVVFWRAARERTVTVETIRAVAEKLRALPRYHAHPRLR